jgi:hypothetical protein
MDSVESSARAVDPVMPSAMRTKTKETWFRMTASWFKFQEPARGNTDD